MGSLQPHSYEQQASRNYKTVIHKHPNPTALFQIFRLFQLPPYNFIAQIELDTYSSNCCDMTCLRTTSPRHHFNMDNLVSIKRNNKGIFVDREIWYFINQCVNTFSFMQANNLAFGEMRLSMFPLEAARFVKLEVLHLQPDNAHLANHNFYNYYSPQIILLFHEGRELSQINIFKSQVFSFGLLLLELLTCPLSRPKFHQPDLSQLLWSHIKKRMKIVEEQRQSGLLEIISLMLREDIRTRPDWHYLKVWIQRKKSQIDTGPCIFWSL